MSCGYDPVKHQDEKVSVGPGKGGDIGGGSGRERFVKSNSKIPFSAQQQKYEDSDMHEANTS